jgi:hypothetical protein
MAEIANGLLMTAIATSNNEVLVAHRIGAASEGFIVAVCDAPRNQIISPRKGLISIF